MTVEHIVLLEEMGGMDVISCAALNIKHIEHTGEVTTTGIKSTLLRYLVLDRDDPTANFDITIEDNRPEQENYNEKRRREANQYKPKRRF